VSALPPVPAGGTGRHEKAVELALAGRDAPFAGAVPEDVIVADGRLRRTKTNMNITYAELLARNGLSSLAVTVAMIRSRR